MPRATPAQHSATAGCRLSRLSPFHCACVSLLCAQATYTASITVPNPLTALMSALGNGSAAVQGDQTTYHFEQKVCMPSYLVAIAVGHLAKRDLSARVAVWSEPEMVDAAANEFAETEKFVQTAEQICGPYVWGRYDMLCLPPSFPYGGMENPTLTFLTPTLLAGDRSLANVVAHEIAHSWSGNLVSPYNWADFWLNGTHAHVAVVLSCSSLLAMRTL
jgi:leukotriene-A4 hydrolase